MYLWITLFLSILSISQSANDLAVKISTAGKNAVGGDGGVVIHKCCEEDQLMTNQYHCAQINQNESQPWAPIFSDDKGRQNIQISMYF